jgi:hypothetical protein
MNRKDKTRITAAGIESYRRSKILLDKRQRNVYEKNKQDLKAVLFGVQ